MGAPGRTTRAGRPVNPYFRFDRPMADPNQWAFPSSLQPRAVDLGPDAAARARPRLEHDRREATRREPCRRREPSEPSPDDDRLVDALAAHPETLAAHPETLPVCQSRAPYSFAHATKCRAAGTLASGVMPWPRLMMCPGTFP